MPSPHESAAGRIDALLARFAGLVSHEEPDPVPESVYEPAFTGTDGLAENSTPEPRSMPISPQTISPPIQAAQLSNKPVFYKNDSNDMSMEPGELAPPDMTFVPWNVVGLYPDRWVGKRNGPRCSPLFKARTKIFSWNFFYIHNPEEPQVQPSLLVPTQDVEDFLNYINVQLNTGLHVPLGDAEKALFRMEFGRNETPRPRFLGKHLGNADKSIAQHEIDFRALVDSAPGYSVEDQATYEASGIIGQQYVSSRTRILQGDGIPADKTQLKRKRADKRGLKLSSMMASVKEWFGLNTPGGPPDAEIVFLAMDIEQLEEAQDLISEVGIVSLDMKNIVEANKDICGSWRNWIDFAVAHHLRIWEYSGLTNSRYVSGCPDKFNFGTSTFPNTKNLEAAVDTIMHPFTLGTRRVVLVGHNIAQDVKHLRQMGIHFVEKYGVIQTIDTQDIHQYWKGSSTGTSLRGVLSDMGIPHSNLHNAGNDAFYTLQSLITLAFQPPRTGADGAGHDP